MVIRVKAFFHEKPPKERRKNELMSSLPVPKAVAKMAIPSVISSLVTVVYNMADTFFVGQTGDPLQVAAIGIVFKANMFITFLQMGLANGVQPLLGYNYGSGDHKRFVSVERYTKKCCVIVGILATALFFVLREPIIRLFISDGEVVYYGVKMLIAYMLSGPVIGLLFVNMNCMQSVGNSFPATILSVMRQGLLLIPLLYLLNACMGLNGVIYGQAFTDYAAVILSVVLWRRIRRRIERR